MNGYGVAVFRGDRIQSRDPAPFTDVEGIFWRLNDGRTIPTYRLRAIGPLEIIYAPRRRALVPFTGIASSLGSIADDTGASVATPIEQPIDVPEIEETDE